ncbi:MAG: helix-turn-helix domain-containing protein [Thermosphaera sp.]
MSKLSYSQLHDLLRIIELYNEGASLKEVSKKLGLKPSHISHLISKGFENEVLFKYYNILMKPLGSRRPTFLMIEMTQKAEVSACIDNKRRILSIYYSFSRKPLLVMYILERAPIPEEVLEINTQICNIVFSGTVEDVIIPLENYTERRIDFKLIDESQLVPPKDSIDELIIFEMYNLFNPPLQGNVRVTDILAHISKKYMLKNILFHYYNHVKDLTYPRLIYRTGGVYSLARIVSPTISLMSRLVNTLFKNGLLVGVDQINLLSKQPAIAVLHGWFDPFKLNDPRVHHETIESSTYEIYPYITLLE